MEIINKAKKATQRIIKYVKNRSAKSTPEALITEAEAKIEKSKKSAGKQLSAIQELTGSIKKELKVKESELIDLQECIRLATEEGDKELLVSLLMEQETAEDAYLTQKKLYDNAVSDAIKISDNYRRFEADVNGLLRNLATLKTRAQFLKMREQITLLENRFEQQTLSGRSLQEGSSLEKLSSRNDIIRQNSIRKKALEKAEALLQFRNR
jgi:hypothetical protein